MGILEECFRLGRRLIPADQQLLTAWFNYSSNDDSELLADEVPIHYVSKHCDKEHPILLTVDASGATELGTAKRALTLTLDEVLRYYIVPKLAETGRGLPDTMVCEGLGEDQAPVPYWTDTRLYKTGATLAIAPKRFGADSSGTSLTKKHDFIRLPSVLNVQPYLHPDSPQLRDEEF